MSNFYPAYKTMELFEQAVANDQGCSYRGFLGKVIPHMKDAYRSDEDGFRTHLGASMIGSECARQLFYNFRWCTQAKFAGRVLRLFNRGHLEEARFIALMLSSGMKIYQQDADGNQFRISDYGGHFGGACDGVVIGCPDVPNGAACLTEMKTHNDASFKKLKKEGVRQSKPEHYVQMQVYMRKLALPCALYLAVNKNDDEIWAEIVPFDPECADMFIDRGIQIVTLTEPPIRMSENATFYKCKWCDHYAICHKDTKPERNCRTCKSSRVLQNGTWECEHMPGDPLTKQEQFEGCDYYQAANYYGNK